MADQKPKIPDSCEGFVLVGGHSLRFGRDKAMAPFRGQPLIAWAVHALEEVNLPFRLVGPDITPYREWCEFGVTNETLGLGPAEAVRTALRACTSEWALILSVDMPQVTGAVLLRLLDEAFSSPSVTAICFADNSGLRHPFPGLYRQTCLQTIQRQSHGGSMQQFLASKTTRLLYPNDIPPGWDLERILHNVNHPDDLRE